MELNNWNQKELHELDKLSSDKEKFYFQQYIEKKRQKHTDLQKTLLR